MGIASIGTKIAQRVGKQQANFAKRKVPRFLYHITNQENCKNIISSGKLETSSLNDIEGIYMINLQNYLKRWKFDLTEELKDYHVGLALLGQALKTGDKISILRIPTQKLKMQEIKIRSQKKLANNATVDIDHIDFGEEIKKAKHYTEKKEALEYIYPESIPSSEKTYLVV